MYININFSLTPEQINQIEEQVKVELSELMVNNSSKLDNIIRDTVKGCIKSIVNEEIQTKNYRTNIARRVDEVLMSSFKGEIE
jgi:hypothetical protein